MRKNIKKVIDAFLKGEEARGDSKNTCSTNGTQLFSYSTVIAEKVGTIVLVSTKRYSATTSMQQGAVRFALMQRGVPVHEVDDIAKAKEERTRQPMRGLRKPPSGAKAKAISTR